LELSLLASINVNINVPLVDGAVPENLLLERVVVVVETSTGIQYKPPNFTLTPLNLPPAVIGVLAIVDFAEIIADIFVYPAATAILFRLAELKFEPS
jgi:hypothetical protein